MFPVFSKTWFISNQCSQKSFYQSPVSPETGFYQKLILPESSFTGNQSFQKPAVEENSFADQRLSRVKGLDLGFTTLLDF